jgi:hypothetical protein
MRGRALVKSAVNLVKGQAVYNKIQPQKMKPERASF